MTTVISKKRENESGPTVIANVNKKVKHIYPQPMQHPPTLQHGHYTTEELRALVKKHDFCIVENVLPNVAEHRKELVAAYASIYDDATVEKQPLGFDLENPETLTKGNTPPFKGSGVVVAEGACGLKVHEKVRLDENVAEVFKHYYSIDDSRLLAKSNDRFGVFLPNNSRSQLDPHIDANVTRPDTAISEDILQGFVVLQQGTQPNQGFVIYPGHASRMRQWNTSLEQYEETTHDRDWFVIPESVRDRIGSGFVINPPAGSMVVWRSTAVHGNTNGGRTTTVGRIVLYVAMYPWALIDDRQKMALERAIVGRTTLGHCLLRATPQKTGATQYGPKLKWRFGAEHLTEYKSIGDLPEGRRRFPSQTNE